MTAVPSPPPPPHFLSLSLSLAVALFVFICHEHFLLFISQNFYHVSLSLCLLRAPLASATTFSHVPSAVSL